MDVAVYRGGGTKVNTQAETATLSINEAIYIVSDKVIHIDSTRLIANIGDKQSLFSSDGEILATYDGIRMIDYCDAIDDLSSAWDSTYTVLKYVAGILLVKENSLYGIIDYNGKLVMPIQIRNIRAKSSSVLAIREAGFAETQLLRVTVTPDKEIQLIDIRGVYEQ